MADTVAPPKTKKCPRCEKTKKLEDFYKDKSRAQGRSRYCKKCHCKVSYESRLKTHDTPEKKRLHYRKYFIVRTYGITLEQYEEMFEAQGGLCAICHKPETETWKDHVKTLAVDHCHETGEVRGLLCSKCNTGLGRLGDSIEHVQAALDYLLAHQNKSVTM